MPLERIHAFRNRAPTPLSINHQGQFPVGHGLLQSGARASLGRRVEAIEQAEERSGCPPSIQTTSRERHRPSSRSLTNEPLLILAALVTVYIVLGVLYESYIHPITILSTLPSAGVGAIARAAALPARTSASSRSSASSC